VLWNFHALRDFLASVQPGHWIGGGTMTSGSAWIYSHENPVRDPRND
jgi:hypothetical protein